MLLEVFQMGCTVPIGDITMHRDGHDIPSYRVRFQYLTKQDNLVFGDAIAACFYVGKRHTVNNERRKIHFDLSCDGLSYIPSGWSYQDYVPYSWQNLLKIVNKDSCLHYDGILYFPWQGEPIEIPENFCD